ncbi:aquaporin-11 isoform X1 [Podarcis raffonei]|uniref:aquaporin-11 isoform X1 n=1 Tax=Podarcis raffonei TaxID=65483 RepID=UPI002329506D|nr:aquaporin-11 isoform X1 [Podarcis raffonei]
MENDHTTMLFLIMGGGTLLLATEVRAVTRNLVSHLELQLFLLEMLATFQLCACFGMLHPLAQMENHAQLYLGHLYSFLTMHFLLTLSESISNPTCILLDILQKGISMKQGGLKIVAQFIGAFLAKLYQNAVWFVGISNLFPHPQECSNPLKTYFLKALCTELVTSITFQFTVLESQSQEIRVRANVLSLAITSLVYAGGHLTGAIFNPALAFSLHISCFAEPEKFWNYLLVYWVAPCIGSVLVFLVWDEILPLLHRQR